MMNPELKARWIEALHSGKYEQGRKHLSLNNRYCCLGVLQCVFPILRNDDSAELIDKNQAISIGIEWKIQEKLSEMNDSGLSFNVIADWIEENL